MNASASTRPRRAVIYVRISVDRDDQTSTDSQERIARDYATAKGWEIVAVESDKGRSAFKLDSRRPGLDRAMRLMESGAADTLIVWKLDRFVRSVAHFGKLWPQLERFNASFVSVTDSFDTTTAMGRAMLQIAVVFAELESGIKSERIEAWHEERILSGGTPTGPRPFGYNRPEGGGLAINMTEAKEIRAAAGKIIKGVTLSSITRDLNARGVPTASTRGTVWRNRTLAHVLTNPTTAGLRETAGLLTPGTWSAILERETWDRVRDILHSPDRRLSDTNQRRHMLSGRLTCGRCGGLLRARPHVKGHRYTCTGSNCSLSVPVDPVDAYVSAAVLGLIDRNAWKRLRKAGRAPAVDPDALEAELVELAEMHRAGDLSLAEWKVMRDGITERAATAKMEPAQLPDVDNLAASWETFSVEDRQLVLAAVVDEIRVDPAKPGAVRFDSERLTIDWRV